MDIVPSYYPFLTSSTIEMSSTTTDIDNSSILRKTRKMFDPKAFDEAWINAMVHNDWAKGNAPTVFRFEDRMEILSFGGLPADFRLERFFGGATDPVNPKRMEIFIQCRFVDKSGHGVAEIGGKSEGLPPCLYGPVPLR